MYLNLNVADISFKECGGIAWRGGFSRMPFTFLLDLIGPDESL